MNSAHRSVRLLLLGALLLTAVRPASASGTVTICTESDLRLALIGGGSVGLACDSTITLTSTLVVSKETVLDGTGHTPGLSISFSTNSSRLFLVQPGARLTLRNLRLTGVILTGGDGTNADDGQPALGAAIYSDHGVVTLEGCTLSGNTVTGGNGAPPTDLGTVGDGGRGAGAAIYNNGGELTVTNSIFDANAAVGGQGGDGATAPLRANGNTGGDGGNGGIGSGAAIYNAGNGSVAIFSSTFSSNRVTGSFAGTGGDPTGVLGFPGSNGDSGAALGAALFNESGTVLIVNSTFIGNSGAGADGTAGPPTSTTAKGSNGSTGGHALGGAVHNSLGSLSMTNCTFAGNSVIGGAGGPGGAGETIGFGGNGGNGGSGGDALGGRFLQLVPKQHAHRQLHLLR